VSSRSEAIETAARLGLIETTAPRREPAVTASSRAA
jgi:hypothetical protein